MLMNGKSCLIPILGHTFLSFSSCYYCTFEIFLLLLVVLETISNVAYNISDPSNDKYPQKEGFAGYENMICLFMICLFCNLSDVFICVSKSLFIVKIIKVRCFLFVVMRTKSSSL